MTPILPRADTLDATTLAPSPVTVPAVVPSTDGGVPGRGDIVGEMDPARVVPVGSAPAGSDEDWLARSVALALENVAQGGGPFGALVVAGGEIVAVGQNRVTRDNDPTAHAEVVAIRAACRELGAFSLAGATLYSSCEPCPLCVSAALWARLDRVVFSADRHDAARGGFDDLAFYELFGRERSTWPTPVVGVRTLDSTAPFEAWLASATRTNY